MKTYNRPSKVPQDSANRAKSYLARLAVFFHFLCVAGVTSVAATDGAGGGGGGAGGGGGGTAAGPSILAPPIKITTIAPEKPLELLVGWTQTVTVQNISTKVVTLKTLHWIIPPQLRSTRGSMPLATMGTNAPAVPGWDGNALSEESALDPGQTRVVTLTMPAAADSTYWFLNPTILTWHYRDLNIPVLATYKTSGTNGVEGSVTETLRVQWQTPFRTMAVGGILGALLAMIFYYLYLRLGVASKYFLERRSAPVPVPPPTGPEELTNIVSGLRHALAVTAIEHRDVAWRQALTAIVTVVIVLVLLASGNQNFLSIGISVNDFAGAVFLGLIAHKLGKSVFDAIFGEKTLPDSTALSVPIVPVLTGTWDPATQQAQLTWVEQTKPKALGYSIRALAKKTDDPSKGKVLKDFRPGEKLELKSGEGLAAAGDVAYYVLVVKQPNGTEVASAPVEVRRP